MDKGDRKLMITHSFEFQIYHILLHKLLAKGLNPVGGQDDVKPSVPVTEPVGTEIPRPKCVTKKVESNRGK
ncbi:hypothetical protein Tco_1019339 [Tanacetum coccineum]|uniref:Uncharacterized protein n=1 Tax=Tanacetum coccineum TaxID=301880 RepID=A0ABQ5FXD5_9ASTR